MATFLCPQCQGQASKHPCIQCGGTGVVYREPPARAAEKEPARDSVAYWAAMLKKSPEVLIEQLKQAGVGELTETDLLSGADTRKYLKYLEASTRAGAKK